MERFRGNSCAQQDYEPAGGSSRAPLDLSGPLFCVVCLAARGLSPVGPPVRSGPHRKHFGARPFILRDRVSMSSREAPFPGGECQRARPPFALKSGHFVGTFNCSWRLFRGPKHFLDGRPTERHSRHSQRKLNEARWTADCCQIDCSQMRGRCPLLQASSMPAGNHKAGNHNFGPYPGRIAGKAAGW